MSFSGKKHQFREQSVLDLRGLATAADLRVPAIEAVSASMTELCATGLGGLDYCAVLPG